MRHETQAARMERLLRTLPPAVRGMGFGDPDGAQYAHASDVVAWAISEIDRLRDERRWIPVEERLPPDNVAVLVNHDGGGVEMAFRERGRWFVSHAGFSVPDCSYTHWQPLPAPPSEGEVEG